MALFGSLRYYTQAVKDTTPPTAAAFLLDSLGHDDIGRPKRTL
jgi:hypothetical protein